MPGQYFKATLYVKTYRRLESHQNQARPGFPDPENGKWNGYEIPKHKQK